MRGSESTNQNSGTERDFEKQIRNFIAQEQFKEAESGRPKPPRGVPKIEVFRISQKKPAKKTSQ